MCHFSTAAHKAATEAETASARPQLTAFAAWLLRRFGASHAAKPELFESKAHRGGVAAEMPAAAAEQIDGAASRPPEPAASAKAAFAEPADTAACGRLRALPQRPLLTVVLRTSKRNGNVSCNLAVLLRYLAMRVDMHKPPLAAARLLVTVLASQGQICRTAVTGPAAG